MLSALLMVATLSAVAELPTASELAGLPGIVEPTYASGEDEEPGRARITRAPKPAAAKAQPKTRAAPQAAPARAIPRVPEQDPEEENEPPSRSKVAPAIVLAGSVVAALVGVVFVNKTLSAIERDPTEMNVAVGGGRNLAVPDIDAIKEQEREVLTNGLIATVSLSGAVAGLVTSSLLLLAD